MPTKNAPTICSIDLGSEHIRVLVAEEHIDGPKLISSGHKPSLKISNGNIHDILLVGEQLLSAVKKAEEAELTLRKWRKLTNGVQDTKHISKGVIDALNDDLNTSKAITVLHGLAKSGNIEELKSLLKKSIKKYFG